MILLVNSATSNVGSWINILKNLDQKYVLSDNQYWNENEIKKIIFPGIGNFYKVSNDILKKNLREKLMDVNREFLTRYGSLEPTIFIGNPLPMTPQRKLVQLTMECDPAKPGVNEIQLYKQVLKSVKL